ncbi:uncharacterized protein LOC131079905 isoform X2 [Cryptomeria japonica]|nr:uncharacterized protein LOC131079905 isoform X2 [Cryptomeria japonica]
MPIIGLEGFLLARASSQVKTCDLMAHSLSPVSLEQSVVNHGGTRCNIMRYKPATQICQFSPQVAETLWLADLESKAQLNLLSNHALCGTVDGLSTQTSVKNERSLPTECTPVIDSSQAFKSHNDILNSIKPEALDISKSFIEVQPKECPADSVVKRYSHNHKQSNESRKVGQMKGFNDSKYPYFAHSFASILSLNLFLTVSALKFPSQKKRFCLRTSPINDSILTGSGTRAHLHFGLALPTVRHTKIGKRSRRVRNHIREKAQKEANENARRILQSLIPRTSDMFTAPADEVLPPNVIPGVLSVISTKVDGTRDIHVRSESPKRLPFFKFQHDRSIIDGRDSKNLWMKNFSFELLKEKGLSLTNPVRALKF